MEAASVTYMRILQNLRDNVPFSFARYGDGEWNCIFGQHGYNCDHHEYFPDLGDSLKEIVLSEPNYIMGMQAMALRSERGDQIKDFIRPLSINWVEADVFHQASINGELSYFIDEIRNKELIIIGPDYLKQFGGLHISVPKINCWLGFDKTCDELDWAIMRGKSENIIVLCACSMMANVIVDRYAGWSDTFIDIGSALDPYCGQKTRSYHHKLHLK